MTKVQAMGAPVTACGETNRITGKDGKRGPRTTEGHAKGAGESDCPILPMSRGNARTLRREGDSEAVQ